MSQVADQFMARLQQHFNEKEGPQWVEDYIEELSKFSGEVLTKAASRIIAEHKFQEFPRLAMCLGVCREIQQEQQAGKDRKAYDALMAKRGSGWEDWSREALDAAQSLIHNSVMAQKAAQEGWILGLWDHCRKKRELPKTRYELDKIKQDAVEAREAHASMYVKPTAAREALERLWQTLEKRRANLGRLARGETDRLVEDWAKK